MDRTNGQFTITNNKGEELLCHVLFTFEDEKFKKNYIVFTDDTQDELTGNTKVYANTYDPSGNDLSLGKIETDEEWAMIENLLSSLQEKTGAVYGETEEE